MIVVAISVVVVVGAAAIFVYAAWETKVDRRRQGRLEDVAAWKEMFDNPELWNSGKEEPWN